MMCTWNDTERLKGGYHMTDAAKQYLAKGAPLEIKRGEYIGRLIDVQPLSGGYVTGIYRFKGGDCCPSEAPSIKP